MTRAFLFLNLIVALVVTGCSRPAETGKSSAAAGTNQQIFQVKGVVVEVKLANKTVTIKHEDVPGYMPAMTMPFDVKNTNELTGIATGDPVSFRLIVTDTEGWIDQIKRVGPKTNLLPTTGHFRLVRDVEPLKVGDPLPDYRFTNQLGRVVSTGQFKGRALAIQFLFTRCPYPTFCPLMASKFEQVQQQLLARTNNPANWHLLTITFDPDFDTPAVLKAYAESHHCDPAHWTFATGPLIDITAIGEQLGLAFWRDETGGISHNLRAAVIDASGRVTKIYVGNEWTPAELVVELVKAAAAK
jgi:protein SCO1/2